MSGQVELTPFDRWLIKPGMMAALWASGNDYGHEVFTRQDPVENPGAALAVGVLLAIVTAPIVVAICSVAFPIIAVVHLFYCIFAPNESSLTQRALAQSVTGIFPVLGTFALVGNFGMAYQARYPTPL